MRFDRKGFLGALSKKEVRNQQSWPGFMDLNDLDLNGYIKSVKR